VPDAATHAGSLSRVTGVTAGGALGGSARSAYGTLRHMQTITVLSYVWERKPVFMEADQYRVRKVEQPWGSGYRLDGPGLQMERALRDEESRERLEDIANLMNFAFEQGRRVVGGVQQPDSAGG
jgi:hypothetical protein